MICSPYFTKRPDGSAAVPPSPLLPPASWFCHEGNGQIAICMGNYSRCFIVQLKECVLLLVDTIEYWSNTNNVTKCWLNNVNWCWFKVIYWNDIVELFNFSLANTKTPKMKADVRVITQPHSSRRVVSDHISRNVYFLAHDISPRLFRSGGAQ